MLTLLVLGVAAGWSLVEVLAGHNLVAIALLLSVWLAAVTGTLAAPRVDRVEWERASRVALGLVFFANRIAVLGVDVLAMAGFLAILSVLTVMQRFDRLFGGAYRSIAGDVRHLRDMDIALALGLARALGIVGLSLVFTLIVSNAIALGFLPLTSSVTALVFALLFIGVVARLARPRPTHEPPGAGNV